MDIWYTMCPAAKPPVLIRPMQPLLATLADRKWELPQFSTHHHYDHAGGNLELKEKPDAKFSA